MRSAKRLEWRGKVGVSWIMGDRFAVYGEDLPKEQPAAERPGLPPETLQQRTRYDRASIGVTGNNTSEVDVEPTNVLE